MFPIGLSQIKWLNFKLYNTFFADDHIRFLHEDFGVLSVDLNNINLDDGSFYKDDPKTIIHVRPLAWHNKLKHVKNK